MKYISIFLIFVSFLSCTKTEKKAVVKEYFIVSKFNNDIEKRIQEAILKNPELSTIKEFKEYDYPKGAINFIFLNDTSVFYYNEELVWNWCGTGLDYLQPEKRSLSSENLKSIKYNEIYNLLKVNSNKEEMKNGWQNLNHISFSFENDTIKDLDIKKLLQNVDSLGYHRFTVRKIAPFEEKAIKEKLK